MDIPQADRMRYWLASWLNCYANAFGLELRDLRNKARKEIPELSQNECQKRIANLAKHIDGLRKAENEGKAGVYDNWLKAMQATYDLASAPEEPTVEAKPIAQEDLPTVQEMADMDGRTVLKLVRQYTGKRPSSADEARAMYADWLALQSGQAALEGADV